MNNKSNSQRLPIFSRSFVSRRTIVLAFQAIVSVSFIYLLSSQFDWNHFFSIVRRYEMSEYLLSFLVVLSVQFIYVFKWYVILISMGHTVPFRTLAAYTFVGFFFANFAPASIGQDTAKVVYLGRSTGYLTVGSSVVIDRMTGLFAMVFWALIGLWFIESAAPVFQTAMRVLGVTLLAFLSVALLCRVPWESLMDRYAMRAGSKAKWVDVLYRTITQFRHGVTDGKLALVSIGLIGVIFAIIALVYMRYLNVVFGYELNWSQVFTVALVVTVISNLPVSLNGIGLREHSHFIFLSALGVRKEEAVSLSLMIFSFALIFSVGGLILWIAGKKRSN